MAGKTTKSSIPSTSANKDLSCLRCRKKKAKCSKTRPTCTRCARSNQPLTCSAQCEYPDAPPNLTDLSQKVLTLYDTLRELEGEFLVKYMQSMDEEANDALSERDPDLEQQPFSSIESTYPLSNNPPALPPPPAHSDGHQRQKRIKQEQEQEQEQEQNEQEEQEPSGWSMSLTSHGLSIHAVTRNLSEFNEFAKTLSRQLMRDFGPSYLPKQWDPDAEGYFEDSEDEELAEDEYLVTVPVFSTSSLLFNVTPNLPDTILSTLKQETPSRDVVRTLLNGADTLATLIQSHFPHMIKHLDMRYRWLEKDAACTAPHHLVILMHQLKMYLPNYAPHQPPPNHLLSTDSVVQVCILTAYVVSVTLLPPIPHLILPPLPTSLWRDCAEYATMLLVDVVLLRGDQANPYPVILSGILLAWIDAELASDEFKADTMVNISLRVLCASDWRSEEPAWQILIAALLYLDVYAATFRFRRPQLGGDGSAELWKAAVQMREPSRWEGSFREAGIVLEARLMSLLSKVVSLFYEVDEERSPLQGENEINVRKIDVDEVLTLVRDVELWEHELPEWARWNSSTDQSQQPSRTGLKMHMHMIHNMVKILLFRPFSTDLPQQEESEQTFTKTTFLDMSTSSADRLATCLCHIHEYGFTGFWTRAAGNLVRDVAKRVLKMFDKDQDIVNQLDTIQQRLEKAEFVKKDMQ
ncbi:Zn(2)-C6 fungal-specific transcription factor [Mucor lusitanicus CBS 277.49]|uniref:Zn(2)-C6 fungal-specific transcription factor n=1 Tax=Mucor lusitanicus CBS 277.49 TaxID=747725 RepID=A0A168L5F1_MUCCL|nr:Zn(2)-C6 fungal-specific transcription factor [Mucor lusitanicus CBS 277.49]